MDAEVHQADEHDEEDGCHALEDADVFGYPSSCHFPQHAEGSEHQDGAAGLADARGKGFADVGTEHDKGEEEDECRHGGGGG